MKISLIVAAGKNGVIGLNNQLIWSLSKDLKRFRLLTSGHHVIMGRKTYESIGRALPNRTNIIVTRNSQFIASDCIIANSVKDAIDLALNNQEEEVFIIGGAEIYNQLLSIADFIYLTLVDVDLSGDAFFPVKNVLDNWNVVGIEHHPKDDKNEYNFQFINLSKK